MAPGTEDWPFASYVHATGREGVSRLAELRGTLELIDGCLVVVSEFNPSGTALFLDYASYRWVDQGLEHPELDYRVELGDEVIFAGSGFSTDDRLDSTFAADFGLPATCPPEVFTPASF